MMSQNAVKRHEAFWENDAFERCTIYAWTAKKDAVPFEELSLSDQWENIEKRTQKALHHVQNTLFLGDGFPTIFTNFGPGSLAACIGGTYKWSSDTVWFENEPFILDWDNPPKIALDLSSDMFKMTDALTNSLLAQGKDQFFTSIADIGGTYDIIAALRGTQEFLMDLYEYPEQIKGFAETLQQLWKEYYLKYAKMLLDTQGAMTTWMPIYSEKSYYPLQCDFSAMISPDMFKEFVLPNLIYQTEHMDRSIYHWDGPGELPHLKHLLSIPRLNAIQWTPGAGEEDVTNEKWFHLYERIQAAGKGLVLLGAKPKGIENLLKHVSTKGLFLSVSSNSEEEISQIIRFAESVGVK